MGWFKKEDKKEKEIPKLPELPRLPKLPSENKELKPISQLPSFPNNYFGEKFSQNTIKEAVAGRKEVEEFPHAPEFEENFVTHGEPLSKQFSMEQDTFEETKKTRDAESIFVRMDNFKEGLQIFEKIKKQISDIEKALEDTKKIKQQEEGELESWEKEIKTMKSQIDKIDKNIFSKVK